MRLLPKIAVTTLVVLTLASCGKASTDTKSTDKPSDKTSASATASGSASATGSPTAMASSTAAPAVGLETTGTGYSYHLPKGWEDISAKLKKKQPSIDTGGRAAPATPPFTANLNTLTTPSDISGEPTQADLDNLATQIKTEVVAMSPKIKTEPQILIDGAPAVHQEGAATSKGVQFFLVQYFAVHAGANYGLTFAFPKDTTPTEREAVVQPVLASWAWS